MHIEEVNRKGKGILREKNRDFLVSKSHFLGTSILLLKRRLLVVCSVCVNCENLGRRCHSGEENVGLQTFGSLHFLLF